MSSSGTLDSRLKKIRKELSLIDDDLKSLSKAASAPSGSKANPPRLKSRQIADVKTPAPSGGQTGQVLRNKSAVVPGPVEPVRKTQPSLKGTQEKKGDERFLEYLSSSFNSGLPMRQERRFQRNKAIVMLVIVLFFLFLLLYRLSM